MLSVKSNQSGKEGDTRVVNHPNNTNIKNKNLNNVNTASRKEIVENSTEEIRKVNAETDEDVNEIRRKIKESLKENESFVQEIAEMLEDDHSLGAFRIIVGKIPKPQ